MYIKDSYSAFYEMCTKGVHTGLMVIRLVEAVGEWTKIPNHFSIPVSDLLEVFTLSYTKLVYVLTQEQINLHL